MREKNTDIARKTLHQRLLEGNAMYIPRVRSVDGADKCVATQYHIAKDMDRLPMVASDPMLVVSVRLWDRTTNEDGIADVPRNVYKAW